MDESGNVYMSINIMGHVKMPGTYVVGKNASIFTNFHNSLPVEFSGTLSVEGGGCAYVAEDGKVIILAPQGA